MASFLIYIGAFFLAMLMVLKLYYSTQPTKTNNPPPSPPTLPIIGNLHQLSAPIYRPFFTLSQRYGRDLMLLHLGSVPTLVVSSAEAARAILQTHDLQFSNRPPIKTFKKISYEYREIGLAPYGDYWRQSKKMLVLHSLTYKQVQTYRGVRSQEVVITLDRIAKHAARKEAVNLLEVLVQHSNDVTSRVTFGRKYNEGESGEKFRHVLHNLDDVMTHFYFEDSIPQLAFIDRITGARRKCDEATRDINAFLEEVLDERRARLNGQETNLDLGEGAEPLIDALLKNQKNGDVGLSLDRDGIKALLMDLYIGGADTVASVIEWLMIEILRHPNVLKKLQSEIRTVVKNRKDITNEEIEQMEYLRAVIMESTRLHPPAPAIAPRLSTEDTKVMGYDIAKGTRVYINVWAVGRDPKAWDRPYDFVPERFIGTPINYVNHEYKLIPFGGGRRMCPGRLFGMAIVENLFAHVLCNFDLTLTDGLKPEDINMTESHGFINRPGFPVKVFATPFP